jgi:thioesterase superfamily protein 4
MGSLKWHFVFKPPSEETKSHFKSVPWASKFFSDPTLQAFVNESRVAKATTNADSFVSRTLSTEETIRAWQSFYRAPGPSDKYGEVLNLISLGDGVNGHVDTSHGGFIGVLLDEALGVAAENSRPPGKSTMTAYLKIDYKKPLRTPGIVLCRARLEKKEGRKIWVKGQIEDGEGNVLSTAEALFLVVERVKPLEKI